MLVKVTRCEYDFSSFDDISFVQAHFFDNIDAAQSWVDRFLAGCRVDRNESHGKTIGCYVWDKEYMPYKGDKPSHELKSFKMIKMEVI